MASGRRSVSVTPGGGQRVHRPRIRELSDRKAQAVIDLICAGNTLVEACRQLGVAPQSVHARKRRDDVFAEDLGVAMDTLGSHVEDIAWDRAVNGVEVPVVRRGEVVGTAKQPSDRLLGQLLEGRNRDFKRDRQAPAVVVVQPLTAEEMAGLRELGRSEAEKLEEIAAMYAEAERCREEQKLIGSGS